MRRANGQKPYALASQAPDHLRSLRPVEKEWTVPPVFSLLVDYPMTRRKRYHVLLDDQREFVMADIHLEVILDHILNEGARWITVEVEQLRYRLMIMRLPDEQDEPPGPDIPIPKK